ISTGLTWTYGYDNANHLTVAKQYDKDPDVPLNGASVQAEVDYTYDAWGNRVETDVTTTGTTVTRYALDGWTPEKAGTTGQSGWDTWAHLDGSSVLQTRSLEGDGIDQRLARTEGTGGSAYWTLTDRMGSVRDVVDGSGVVKDHIDYNAWGNIRYETPG